MNIPKDFELKSGLGRTSKLTSGAHSQREGRDGRLVCEINPTGRLPAYPSLLAGQKVRASQRTSLPHGYCTEVNKIPGRAGVRRSIAERWEASYGGNG